ncbi:MAG: hypothetical protein BMS9Abin37_0449 [Acidobacteriota bacterium]|nr:MAG: hypothetical protein BMS9Abin37_0449 [Acidobacteriota bacterium]
MRVGCESRLVPSDRLPTLRVERYLEHVHNVLQSTIVFPQNPIAVFAHDRQTVKHDGLPAADDGGSYVVVTRLQELERLLSR